MTRFHYYTCSAFVCIPIYIGITQMTQFKLNGSCILATKLLQCFVNRALQLYPTCTPTVPHPAPHIFFPSTLCPSPHTTVSTPAWGEKKIPARFYFCGMQSIKTHLLLEVRDHRVHHILYLKLKKI